MRHLGEGGFRGIIFLSLATILSGILYLITVPSSDQVISERHDAYVRARPPWHGRPWKAEKAIIYMDVDHPLTWHACTKDRCGDYFEDCDVEGCDQYGDTVQSGGGK